VITVLSPSPALDVTYLLEGVTAGRIHRPQQVLRQAGGKGLNLARAARVLGAPARVVAPLGGRIGDLVSDLAAAEGIELAPVVVAGETRMCVSAIPAEEDPTEFYEPAGRLSASDGNRLLKAFTASAASGWSVLAGRLPDAEGLAQALASRRNAGDRVAVDSSGPRLSALLDEVPPDLLKVNVHEAAELTGHAGSAADLAAALRDRTGGTVVVTDGAAGAVAVDATGSWRAAADPQPGRYAIGSGDSFFAGLLTGLAGGADLADALRAASAAGSANTRVPGAGVFTRADYDAALRRILVTVIR
jgi:1-phosphofructokinase family hexose kinase